VFYIYDIITDYIPAGIDAAVRRAVVVGLGTRPDVLEYSTRRLGGGIPVEHVLSVPYSSIEFWMGKYVAGCRVGYFWWGGVDHPGVQVLG